jgi:hypothetical protein
MDALLLSAPMDALEPADLEFLDQLLAGRSPSTASHAIEQRLIARGLLERRHDGLYLTDPALLILGRMPARTLRGQWLMEHPAH